MEERMDTMEQKTERAAFEAWAEKNWMYVDVKDNSWEVWRAAIAAERERCANLCEKARFTGNTFPRTQMEQLRMDIAAAIRGN